MTISTPSLLRTSLLLCFCFVFTYATYGQDIKEAVKMVNNDQYESALKILEPLLQSEPDNADAWYYAGVCHIYAFSSKRGLEYLKKAEELNPYLHEELYHTLGVAYHYNYEFDKAIECYNKFIERLGTAKLGTKVIRGEHVQKLIEEAENGKVIYAQQTPFFVINIGSKINSEKSELAPVLSSDSKTLIFTTQEEQVSSDAKGKVHENYLEEMYEVKLLEDDTWSSPTKITSEGDGSGVQLLNSDQQLVIYRYTKNGNLYVSDRQSDGSWSEPYPLKGVNTPAYEGHGFITADGQKIFFSSNNKSRAGDLDLYVSEKMPNGDWGKPTPLGDVINTTEDEDSPFLTADGQTLYFSSRGHNTMGGYDVFKSTYNGSAWSKPENLGYPINTPKEDIYFTLESGGTFGFVSSNREGTVGRRDLYMFGIREQVTISGQVLSQEEQKLVADRKLDFINDRTGEKYTAKADKDGKYTVTLPSDEPYRVEIIPGEGTVGGRTYTDSLYAPLAKSKNVTASRNFSVPDSYLGDEYSLASRNVTLKGQVRDADEKELVNAEVIVRDKTTNQVVGRGKIKSDGSYDISMPIESGKNYAIDVKRGDITYSEVLEVNSDNFKRKSKGRKNETQTFALDDINVDITVQEVKPGSSFVLKNIYFPVNSSYFKTESKETLELLYQFLAANPKVTIEISGYTDNTGAAEYNMWLSERRAQRIVGFLAERGIPAERMIAKGFGMDNPAASNQRERGGRELNRRCEMKILGTE